MTTQAYDVTHVLRRVTELIRPGAKLVAPDEEVRPDAVLADLGVDSMALVELLFGVEDEFGLVIPDELLVPETFESAAALTAVIVTLLAGRP